MITVHHLKIGRPLFTLWLIEELGLEYDLKIYERNEMGRAPQGLKEVHPLGKSPVIQDGDLTLSESGAIALYLVENFDKEGRFTPPSDAKERATWNQWFHYTEASAFAPLLIKLLLTREADPKPQLFSMFGAAEVKLQLDYISGQLGDNDFILGDTMTLPDFGIAYILQMAERLGELGDYPTLAAYNKRIAGISAFQRAFAKTGG